MVSFFPWLICIKNSISWSFGFEACVRIRVGGHVIVFRVRGDTVDEIIGDLVLALAVFVDAGGF